MSVRFILGAFGVGGALIGGVLAFQAAGFYANKTPSLPLGIWHVAPGAITRGAVVLACPPQTAAFRAASAAGYLPHGNCPGARAPLLKPVAAVAGDRVEVTPDGVRVNGRALPRTALVERDGKGRPLPRAQLGVHVVRPGEVWLLSSYNPYSFDSRYFGPIATSRVRGIARPVWLAGGA